jgi:hypothetical protein
LQFQLFGPALERGDRALTLGDGIIVAFSFAQFNERGRILELLLKATNLLDGLFEAGTVAKNLLRALLIVPKGRILS